MAPNDNETTTSSETDVYHDEVEIEDFEYDEETDTFTYPCPCGDLFTVTREELESGECVATCPTCSLVIKVIYNSDDVDDLIRGLIKARISPVSQGIKTTG